MNATDARIQELALSGLSHQEAARELTQLSPSTVRVYFNRIVQGFTPEQRARMEAARTARGVTTAGAYHKPFAERKSYSAEHIRIGRKLLDRRMAEGMTLGEFSSHHDFSNRVTLSAMEQGYHDFTMTEICKIASMLETSIEDLMCPPPGALAA